MSTLVSFACAMGVEMGYNENHHQEVVVKTSLTHQHGDSHEHSDATKHQHSKTNDASSEKKADDCCKKEAKKFGQFDKIVSKVSFDIHQPIFFISFIQSVYSFDLSAETKLINVKSNLYRSHHPPIPDKLIAFQSFLI